MTTMSAGRRPLARSMLVVLLATAAILLVPLAAMQVTDEVNWGLEDFAVAGALLAGTGLLYVAAARRVANGRRRLAVGLVLGAALLLIWAELAVGIVH